MSPVIEQNTWLIERRHKVETLIFDLGQQIFQRKWRAKFQEEFQSNARRKECIIAHNIRRSYSHVYYFADFVIQFYNSAYIEEDLSHS